MRGPGCPDPKKTYFCRRWSFGSSASRPTLSRRTRAAPRVRADLVMGDGLDDCFANVHFLGKPHLGARPAHWWKNHTGEFARRAEKFHGWPTYVHTLNPNVVMYRSSHDFDGTTDKVRWIVSMREHMLAGNNKGIFFGYSLAKEDVGPERCTWEVGGAAAMMKCISPPGGAAFLWLHPYRIAPRRPGYTYRSSKSYTISRVTNSGPLINTSYGTGNISR